MPDSFTITFGGRPVIDPQSAMRTCREHGFPDDHFRGLVTSYVCPTGPKPGVGYLLMRKKDLDATRNSATVDLVITYRAGGAATATTLRGMIITASSMAFPGRDDDDDSVFLVSFADGRHAKRRVSWSKAYNLRQRNDTEYITTTTNGGTAWTWQQLVQDLWTPSIGGTAPTLPYTPNGTPEGLDFYHSDSALDCLADVLLRINCQLVHDPRTSLYTIRRSANGRAGLTAIDSRQRNYAWQDRGTQWPQADWPATIRVRFRKRPIPAYDADPYVSEDVTTTPAPSVLVSGTILQLDDDLFALYPAPAGTLTNGADLTSRATERMQEWVRRRTSIGFPLMRSYKGVVPELFDQLGETVSAICISDRGGSEGAALTTEIRNPDGSALDDWKPRENPHWVWWADETPVTIPVIQNVVCDGANIVHDVVNYEISQVNRDGKIFLEIDTSPVSEGTTLIPLVCKEFLTPDSSIACVDGNIVFTKVSDHGLFVDCEGCP